MANPLDGRKLTNGELVDVKDVLASGDIKLKDGRVIPASFGHFTHGYAITSQSAQGLTVDHVFLSVDALSALTATATAETFYVGVTRGKRQCSIYTDAKDLLADAFSRSGEREAAMEFLADEAAPITTTTHENNQSANPANSTNGNSPEPGGPLPATRLAPHPQGHDHPDYGQVARSGVDARKRALHPDHRRGESSRPNAAPTPSLRSASNLEPASPL